MIYRDRPCFRCGRVRDATLPQQRHLRGRRGGLHVHLPRRLEGQDLHASWRPLRGRYLPERRHLPGSRRQFHVSLPARLGGRGVPHRFTVGVREQPLRERRHVREHGGRQVPMRLPRGLRGSELPARRRRLPTTAVPERRQMRGRRELVQMRVRVRLHRAGLPHQRERVRERSVHRWRYLRRRYRQLLVYLPAR